MRTMVRPSLRSLLRVLAVAPVLASLSLIGTATRVGPFAAGCAQAASVHHAALVVEHGDGAVLTFCVPFTVDSITGEQLLADSHVQFATAGYGGIGKAVCQVDGEPAQYPPGCWTASSPYWAMFVSRGGGSWTISSLGISSQTFRDGDAEGFRYEGQSDYTVPPSPAGVCPAASSPTPVRATPTPTSHAVTKPTGRAASVASSPATTAAPAAVPPTPTVAASSSPIPTSSATSAAIVATPRRMPPSQPASFTTGAWIASGLALVLLVVLAVQAKRLSRRASPPRWQP
jgi:hypothetical protein